MIHFWLYFVLVFARFDVGSFLPAGKNISLTKLYSIQLADLPDLQNNIKRKYGGMGIDAGQSSASLGQNVTLFRLHRPGFQHVDRSVALESNSQPSLYLRYKNYKFHMEKAKPTGLFEKDSTFIERNPFGSNSIALELFSHPGWFVCHDTTKPFILKAASKVVRSKEFDQKCVFRQTILKVYGPKPQKQGESYVKAKELDKAKAAQILESLVPKEPVAEILAVNKEPPAAKQPQRKTPARGAIKVGTALSFAKNSQISFPNPRASIMKVPYRRYQNANSYNSAFARMKYRNNLRRKIFPQKPFSRGSQNVYTRYMHRVPGRPLQSRYRTPYRTPQRLFQYSHSARTNYRNTWPRMRRPVYSGLDLRGGPGSMRPGKVLHMARYPAETAVHIPSNGYRNPLKQQSSPLPIGTAYKFINPYKQQQYNTRLQAGTTSVANHVMSVKPRPIIGANQMMSLKVKPIVWGYPILPPKVKPVTKSRGPMIVINHMTSVKPRPVIGANQGTLLKVKPIVWGNPVIPSRDKHITKSGSNEKSGSGSGEFPVAKHGELKAVDPKKAVYGIGDKCISIRFYNKMRKPVKIVSSMKREGYLVTAETFKLKTIFKHARKGRKVHFYAQDLNDKEDALLNNNNVITVIPGPCDLPYRSIYLSRNGQYTNEDIEEFLNEEEQKEIELARSKIPILRKPSPQDGFSEWSEFGSCSTTCGRGFQTRHRICKPGKVCLGTTKESRACIHTPCSEPYCVQTYGGNVGTGKCCALPFIFQDTVYDKCIVHPRTGGMWCSTTPNYDQDRSWGFCKLTERRSDLFYRPRPQQSSALIPSSHETPFRERPNTCRKSCYTMCVPGCHVNCCSAHALAFPSMFTDKATERQRLLQEH